VNEVIIDATDRSIINEFQSGIPVCERPFAPAADALGIDEYTLIQRLIRLRKQGILSRIGPMYHAERMGGGLTLAAMRIPKKELDRVAEQVNAFDEVAHNYEREHTFNMWFVLATETVEGIADVLSNIEQTTGYPVYNMPKLEEFYVGLRFDV